MQPGKYFTDQSMYRYFAYRRLAKVAGRPAALSKRLVQVTGPSACWDEADTPNTGRPRSTTHPDALLTRRGDNRTIGPGNLGNIADEISAQLAVRRDGSLAGVVLQPGLHVDALVGLERWAIAR